jgi:hypothetical protein
MKNLNNSLSSKALLVNVNISQWAARKKDQNATETVKKEYNTDETAGGYTKKLLPGASELDVIATVTAKIRKYFHTQTLPWMIDGSRIISAKNHLKFSTEFRKMRVEFDQAVSSFIAAYPSLQARAVTSLGTLYNAAEYPDVSEIAEKFKCEIAYLPLPDAKDFRIDISESEKKEFQEKMKQVENEAIKSVWERLYNVVKNASEKLNSPDAIFRDSLLENVTEICALLPVLNITDDQKLDGMKVELETLVKGLGSADSIRSDKGKRQKAAKALKDVTEKMSIFAGI